ncbi:MAG: hypothetical protein CL678_08095 [Bdellovibrionaceae bacterium]|nr:hypothetical protein [Pseudobdellovibrionaceae bacterium]|tara:strand:+ start:13 stop:1488 length:1476 start_codon:yes stop_codon:yes gene_type:complete
MYLTRCFFSLYFILIGFNAKGETVLLSDQALLKMISDQTPSVARIRSAFYAGQAALEVQKDQFALEGYSSAGIRGTKERALLEFSPVFSPIRTGQIGVKKQFQYGVSLDANVSVDQRSATSSLFTISNGTTLSGQLSLSFDLWKDFLGRTSSSKLTDLEMSAQRAVWEEKINIHLFKINVRRLYWRLVANQESQILTESLLKTAEVQLKDAEKRQANSIADSSEVARYQSQVADRKANLVFLNYQKNILVQDLKNLLPQLKKESLELKPYDLDQTVQQVLACTKKISEFKEAPLENTYYDEILKTLEKQKTVRLKADRAYNDIDLKLNTQLGTTGVDAGNGTGTLSGAFSDLSGRNRMGYAVGLELTVPLSASKNRTQRMQELRDQYQLDAEQVELKTKIEVAHRQLLESMNSLTQVVRLQRKNSEFLRKRLKGLRKKYNQARIDVSTLVNDQSAQLSADLSVIESQTHVLNALFEYLSIFTQTPCEFNRS